MSSVTIYAPRIPSTAADAGARLHAAFLAGRSPHTLRAYGADLEAFAAFLGDPGAGAALSRLIGLPAGEGNGVLLAYRAHMIDAGLTPATINRRLAAIRSALKLARTLGLTAWAPEIRGLKVEAYRDTTGPGLAGTRAMLAQARAQTPLKATRDAVLVRLMFDLGLRRGEVTGLDVEDLEPKERRLWIRGKGRAQKEARTLPEPTFAAIAAWIDVRARFVPPEQKAMFIGLAGRVRGQRLTGRGLYHVIAELGAAIGLKTRPHGLRHASITAALDANNGDVRAVQLHARHADPQTTMRYDDNRQDLAGRVAASLANVL
jgi:integrase/recombinase XerC